jgi:hypothetical protein
MLLILKKYDYLVASTSSLTHIALLTQKSQKNLNGSQRSATQGFNSTLYQLFA